MRLILSMDRRSAGWQPAVSPIANRRYTQRDLQPGSWSQCALKKRAGYKQVNPPSFFSSDLERSLCSLAATQSATPLSDRWLQPGVPAANLPRW
jgi:hypothetical protein